MLHTADQPPASDEWLESADLSAVHAALLETIDHSVILTDMHGRIRAWNAGARRIFGYEPEEMIGRTPADLYPDMSPERLAGDLDRIVGGQDYAGEWQGRRRDGSTVWVEIRTRVVRDRAGRPLGFLGVARDITERRQSAAELASGKARLELIANTAPAFIVQCDVERRFTFVNRAYAARFGLEPEQVVGKYVWEVVGERAYAGFKHHVDEVLSGRRVDFEMEIPYELIGRHYIQCSYAPQFGPDHGVQGLVAVITDIGERKRAEAALREQEALLRTVLEALPVGVWVCDKDGAVTYANPAVHRIWGRAPLAAQKDWGVFKTWWPDGRPLLAAENPLLDVLRTGAHQLGLEWEIETFEGKRKSILAANVPLRNGADEIIGAVSLNMDVTEQKRAEAALRESDTRLKLAQTAAGLAIWEWDPSTDETSYTPELTALYGLPPDSGPLSFRDWRDRVLHPEDRRRVTEEVQAALRRGHPYETEYRVVTPDGDVRWIAGRGQLVSDPSGRKSKMVGVHFDVTRRREAELQLRQLDRVETVARLAGGVAHEANNQMAVVLGAASFILRHADLPETVRRDAIYIQEAAERTAAITQQLLAFSRRQVLQLRVLDLNATIRAFETILRRTVAEHVELRLDLAPALGQVRIDEGQLQQVLLNLTLNARDAMPNGGTLTLETREIAVTRSEPPLHGVDVRPGTYVEMIVRDTGIGMDGATLAHMFEPFFTTKGVGRGTGLGLASVYGIVKQSNGYVFADSSPGRGTSLTVLLPVATDALVPEDAPAAMEAQGRRGTALVVDDEPVVRSMMVRALRGAGYTALGAESGAAALELARSHRGPIDILISDLAMPGMSGRALAERLVELYPDLGVLFVSGYPGEEVERRGLLESGRPFLQKPFAPEALVERVGRLLAATGARREHPQGG